MTIFSATGDPWAGVPLPLLQLPTDLRTAAVEVWIVLAQAARSGTLDERLTDARIAAELARSESHVQKGLHILHRGTGLAGALIDRAREHGRRTITIIRGLAGRGTKAPPGPPEEGTGTASTAAQDPTTTPPPPPIPEDDPTITRGIRLIPDATPTRLAAAIHAYSAEWVEAALDQVERRNAVAGKLPVKTLHYVLVTLASWRREGGPPARRTAPPPQPPPRPAPAPPEPPPAPLTPDQLTELVRQCSQADRVLQTFAALQLRAALAAGLVPTELLPTVPAEILEHRRE